MDFELLSLVKDVLEFIDPHEKVSKPAPSQSVIEKPVVTKDGNLLKMHSLFKEVGKNIRVCDPYPPLLFFYFSEEEKLFMDKVVQALFQNKIAATTVDGQATDQEEMQRIFDKSSVALYLVTLPSQSKLADWMPRNVKTPHTKVPAKKEGSFFLLLHPVSSYQTNEDLKRSLWQTLKNYPTSR